MHSLYVIEYPSFRLGYTQIVHLARMAVPLSVTFPVRQLAKAFLGQQYLRDRYNVIIDTLRSKIVFVIIIIVIIINLLCSFSFHIR